MSKQSQAQHAKRAPVLQVPVSSSVLRWAQERSGISRETLEETFPKLGNWESGEAKPTVKDLERFAKKVHVPVGRLYLSKPPKETLPITDFRTLGGKSRAWVSPDLREMISACMERQSWYRDYAKEAQHSKLPFVGSATIRDRPEEIAGNIRATISFNLEERAKCSDYSTALRLFIRKAENAGILVMVSGVVRNNTHRDLSVEEFRGFALADEEKLAPLVFVNGADAKAAQIFTLAHELAHIWLNKSGISNVGMKLPGEFRGIERWCNEVAAELLVPEDDLLAKYMKEKDLNYNIGKLARHYKVSRLVILLRLRDLKLLPKPEEFKKLWSHAIQQIKAKVQDNKGGSGGNYYYVLLYRNGLRFPKAVFRSVDEGSELHREAYKLLDIKKTSTLDKFKEKVEQFS